MGRLRRDLAVLAMLAFAALPCAQAGAHEMPERPTGARALARTVDPAPVPWISPTWCPGDPGRTTEDTADATSGLPDLKVIYAYASDQPNNFLAYADEIQRVTGKMARVVADSHGSPKTLRFDLGTPCGPQYVDVLTVRLPRTLAQWQADQPEGSRLTNIGGALLASGVYADRLPNRKYLVYADGMQTGNVIGASTTAGDARPGPENFNNTDPKVAVVYGRRPPSGCTQPAPATCGRFYDNGFIASDALQVEFSLHEVFHALGAVLEPALHNPEGRAAHCSDEYDVMCQQQTSYTYPCPNPDDLVIDCGADDYFNPSGPIMGYALDTSTSPATERPTGPIWNTYDSDTLCLLARCANRAPVPALSAPAGAVRGAPATWSGAGSSDDDGITAYEWDLDGDGTYETSTGTTPQVTVAPASAGTVVVGLRVTDTDRVRRVATVATPVAEPQASPGGGAAGGAATPPADLPPAATPARLSALKLASRTFRAAKGTRVTFRLTRAARVVLKVERRTGRRYVALKGSIRLAGRAGANRLVLRRVAGRTLPRGTFRLAATVGGRTVRSATFRVR